MFVGDIDGIVVRRIGNVGDWWLNGCCVTSGNRGENEETDQNSGATAALKVNVCRFS
jgi:hypothetical protein